MGKKKILIPGGKFSDWALVNAAHRLGMYVITSGTDEKAPAHQFSDEYIPADYSDKEAMLRLAKEKKIDYMCSCANDYGMLSTAYVCEQLGLPGHDSYETTWILHHKDTFKPIAKKLGIHAPISEVFDDRDSAIRYIQSCNKKVIVKPADNVASNGVSTPETPEDIAQSVDFAFSKSKNKKIIIEPFIEGFFAPFTSLIINQKVVAFFCNSGLQYPEGERIGPKYPIYGKNNGIAQPCLYSKKFSPYIIEDINKIARELNLVDGKFHGELMVTPEHEAYIFDVHRRMSGFTEPWPEWNLTTDLNWEDWIVKAECGMDLSDFPVGLQQHRYFHQRNIYAPRNGHIQRVIFDEYLTSHIYPRHTEKNYFLYDVIVTDYKHQPVVNCCTDESSTSVRGNILKFEFDSEEELERIADPANSEEFYKHIKFEYNDI